MKSLMIGICASMLAAGNAGAALFGRDGMDADCPNKHSRAWCALDAIEVHKDSNQDLSKRTVLAKINQNDNSKTVETVADVAMIGATLMGAFTPAPGFSNIGEAGMLLMGMVLGSSRKGTSGVNVAFGWMPYEMASSAEEARRLFYKTMLDATMKSFEGYQLEMTTARLPNLPGNTYSVKQSDNMVYRLKGPGCEKGDCALVQFRELDEYVIPRWPAVGVAPAWMGGHKAWVFNSRSGQPVLEFWTGNEYASNRYLLSMSKALPKWAMISMSPQGTPSAGHGVGMYNRGVALPFVLSEGNVLAPIFPELDFAAKHDGSIKVGAVEK